MEPATILGALVGGYLNKVSHLPHSFPHSILVGLMKVNRLAPLLQAFPNWLTTILLALLLTFISYKLIMRGLITWQKESAQIKLQDSQGANLQPLLEEELEANAGEATDFAHARR